jgi:hypothetical protein
MRWTRGGPIPIRSPHTDIGRNNRYLDRFSEKTSRWLRLRFRLGNGVAEWILVDRLGRDKLEESTNLGGDREGETRH